MKFKAILTLLILASALFIYRQLPELRTYKGNGEAQALVVSVAETQVPPPTPTATVVPTMTVGYQETAIVAQATAMEAVRVNAQITAEYERRVQEQLQMTAQADREWFNIQSWTATVALTSIPLTATQQAVLNTQIPAQQVVALAQINATNAAPTQLVAMERAKQDVRFAGASKVASIVGMWSVSLFCVALVVFLVVKMRRDATWYAEQGDDEPQEQEPPKETVIHLKRDTGGGMGSTTRYVIPCTPEQLSELAELAINGERTFAINRLETNSRTLRRDVLYAFRNWAVKNKFAIHPKIGSQEIVMNDEGICLLEGWFENRELPEGYRFGEGEPSEESPA